MNSIKPAEILSTMIQAGATKASLPVRDLLLRSMLSGALLGISTTLAITATVQSIPLVGALVFPVGFVMIVLLGLELVTGNFALLPLAVMERKIPLGKMLAAFGWVFLGNLLGSLIYAGIFWAGQSMFGQVAGGPVADKIVAIAQLKTTGFSDHGWAGIAAAFCRAVLCNWMVCFGVVMAMSTSSTSGKILAAWLPIFMFFAQGFEHAVVNMFVIPCGMLFGAKVTLADWWLSNQLVVTLGNFTGGLLFTGLALYLTYRQRQQKAAAVSLAELASIEDAEASL
ncbi:MAG: formate transporter [Akkermansiaceae bacterium]|nr:formate transporter [Akkermansiaceae bacterium]